MISLSSDKIAVVEEVITAAESGDYQSEGNGFRTTGGYYFTTDDSDNIYIPDISSSALYNLESRQKNYQVASSSVSGAAGEFIRTSITGSVTDLLSALQPYASVGVDAFKALTDLQKAKFEQELAMAKMQLASQTGTDALQAQSYINTIISNLNQAKTAGTALVGNQSYGIAMGVAASLAAAFGLYWLFKKV